MFLQMQVAFILICPAIVCMHILPCLDLTAIGLCNWEMVNLCPRLDINAAHGLT